ncbi:Spherulation-specific family 4-domain-containing protein [Leptodontidium sp. MPI-SDFR-AT-0119]|nr:Spherulation-specific family 4-domain-containing protein [Leptodontidium sp. MPI-SDFR-AT-0119]
MLLQLLVTASTLLPALAIPSAYSGVLHVNSEQRDVSAAIPQQIAIASYIHPLADADAWARMIAYPKEEVSVLIANVVNGPDTKVDSDWKKVITDASAAGKRVIGYVRTGYFGLNKDKTATRLGSINLADWISQIERDVDLWYALYPGTIGGIFFDEAWNECGVNNVYSEAYRLISENTKRKYPGAFTVLNPGAPMPQCFENSADTLMTFENTYQKYNDSYKPNDWTAKNGRKIWHIIYDVPQDKVAEVANKANERGAGLIEVTNDSGDNPYDQLPKDPYMQILLNAVSGDSPGISDPLPFSGGPQAATPSGLKVDSAEYSSVSLSWSAAANAIGYKIYLNGAAILCLTKDLTRVTVGNIDPGTSGLSFEVTAVGGDGTESAKSNTVTSSTTSPPTPGRYVFDVTVSATETTTTYSTSIVVPYAFIRIFIWDVEDSCPVGWPINSNTQHFVCNHYMVENKVLYIYAGRTLPDGNATFEWKKLGEAVVTNTGYTQKWVLPIGTSTTDTTKFVLQTAGYGPSANVFHPCPVQGVGPDGNGRYCA